MLWRRNGMKNNYPKAKVRRNWWRNLR